MPAFYSKPQLEILLDLINEANPGLMELRDLENSRFGNISTYIPKAGEIADTALELYALPGSFYIGKRIVYYRRIQLQNYFANMVLEFDDWWPNTTMGKADYCAMIAKKYGITFTADEDLLSSHGNVYSGNQYTLSVSPTSKIFAGTFKFKWTRGKRTLEQVLTQDQYTGLYWDENYVEGKPLMNLVGMAIDFSRFGGAKTITTGSAIAANSSDVRNMADWFSEYTGQVLDVFKLHTEQGGIQGLNVTRFTLPNTNVPEANSDKFNRCLVIAPKADSWFAGKIIWHYNE